MAAIGDVEVGSESAANRVRKQLLYIFEGRDNAHPSSAGNFSSPMPISMELKQTIVLRLELGSKIEKVIVMMMLVVMMMMIVMMIIMMMIVMMIIVMNMIVIWR